MIRSRLGAISTSTVNALAAAIQTQEGYYPGSLAYTNNNPGNLVFAGQSGAVPGAGGFARFPSYDAGVAALKDQITLDVSRGSDVNGRPINTLADLISSWAPASDPRNNTPAYIASVAAQTGLDPNAPLSDFETPDYSITVYLPAGGDGSGSDAGGALDAAAADSSAIGAGLNSSVDLSAIGGPSSVPLWWIGAGVLGILALSSVGGRR